MSRKPRLPIRNPQTAWLDPPLALPGGGWFVPDAGSSPVFVRWIAGGAQLLWSSVNGGVRVGKNGRAEHVSALVVADAATLTPLRAIIGLGGGHWATSEDEQRVVTLRGHFDDGGELRPATGYQNTELSVWDLTSGKHLKTIPLPGFVPERLLSVRDGAATVLGAEGHAVIGPGDIRTTARAVDLVTGAVREVAPPVGAAHGCATPLRKGDAHPHPRCEALTYERLERSTRGVPIDALSFAPGGDTLTVSHGGRATVWSVRDRRVIDERPAESTRLPVGVWAAAHETVVAAIEGNADAFAIVSPERRIVVPAPSVQLPGGVCFDEAGATIFAYLEKQRAIGRWRTEDGAALGVLALPNASAPHVAHVAYWPARRRVVVSYFGALPVCCFIDTAANAIAEHVLLGPAAGLASCTAFSDDGKTFAIGWPNGHVMLRRFGGRA